ncbi:Hypothetical predicted protein [Cloeon dipterum]|uniref:Vacuolar protein-sorting-associated protein 36 n=1 Tax=Cloeon dipterum TaxID=197152 RepID=A0A8S1BSA8_9INSE|nr:Hypothetical predicted protein [Cloeon dipterum]
MDRLEYDDPILHPKEDEIAKLRNVKIYDGDAKSATFENGELIATSHRLVYVQSGSSHGLSLRLHYLVYVEEEKSSGFGFSRSKKLLLHLSEPLPGKPPGPVDRSSCSFIRLSFKDGYDSSFPNNLSAALQKKKWETAPITSTSLPEAPPLVQVKIQTGQQNKIFPYLSFPQLPGRQLRAGIVGIERQIQAKHKATDDSISLAFEDLNKLMSMAKDMVLLSKSISDKIKEKQGEISDDETVQFKSYLLSLGIDDPVTRDNSRSESQYHQNLARQISSALQDQIKEIGGMMTLPEAYCRVNRARGLELLSPEDMLKACQIMASLGLPVTLKVFDSGVKVLHLSTHNDQNIIKTTAEAIEESGSYTAEELAQVLGMSVLLAKERLLITEKAGRACRDDSIEGLRFYPNLLLEKN